MLLSSRAVSDSKKSRFITDQEAKGLLSLICKVPVLGKLVIWCIRIVVIIIYLLEYLIDY